MEPICERCSHAKESHNGRCRIKFTNGIPCRCTTFVFPLPPSKTAYGGYPMPKITPAPTMRPEVMAGREWSRYARWGMGSESEQQMLKAAFEAWPEPKRAFGDYKTYQEYGRSKTTPRKSKTAPKRKVKSKKTKAIVDKLTLTRVPPVLDEEV